MSAPPPTSQLTRFQRALCFFRGIAPEHLALHPSETASLRVQVIAMLLPMLVAAINGWLMAREAGAGVLGCSACALFVAFLIYGLELVLLQLVGRGGWRSIPAVIVRTVVAVCLAVLIGEGLISGVLFKDPIADHYRQKAQAAITEAAAVRDEAQRQAELLRSERLAPLRAVVAQLDVTVAADLRAQAEAQRNVQEAKEILFAEEEGKAASGIIKRGNRFREKDITYHQPALARLATATAKLAQDEAKLAAANAAVTAALTLPNAADEQLKTAQADYQRKVDDLHGQPHHDLGSRCDALYALALQRPVIGVFYLIAIIFFVSVDLGPVLLKTLGRRRSFDQEETHELAMTALRLQAETTSYQQRHLQIAELHSQSLLRGAISQSALTESLSAIQSAVAYQQAIFDHRQAVVTHLEKAHAANRPDLVALCRKTLEAIDYWAERGLLRSTECDFPAGNPSFAN